MDMETLKEGGGKPVSQLSGRDVSRHIAKVSSSTSLEGKDLRDLDDWLGAQVERAASGKKVAADTLAGLTDFWMDRAAGGSGKGTPYTNRNAEPDRTGSVKE